MGWGGRQGARDELVVTVGSCCEGSAVSFKCAGAGVVVCKCADRIERLQYACVVQGVGVEAVLSAFASLMGEFVVCKNSGLGGSIIGLLL